MITGVITGELEPVLNDVSVFRPDGSKVAVKTILDTGFNGSFCLPRNVLQQMKLKNVARETFELADGSVVEEVIYIGKVTIADESFTVEISGTDSETALMGMAMLIGKKAVFDLQEMTVSVF